ncbi:glycoside hydrolase superfamily [Dactylonectria estremocensis]|uniref:beta-glucosidase n=1 Tax=Dactylonectria estremocensis TaxID=1079267 RepID=A0A9P9EGA4_9HYPO|nr:glycoside hydrolase superfamily [Dactylonectria estremocensis]
MALSAIVSVQAADNSADGSLCGKAVPRTATYLNPKASRDKRVKDLLSRMCWEEKVAQIGGVGGLLGQNSTFDLQDYRKKAQLHNGTISPGSYLNYAEDAVPVLSGLIVASKKEHRLGIPYVHIADAVNGPTLRGTTLFPSTLSMAMSWNLPLYTEVAEVLRDELVACGVNWVLSPEVDVARDPRNGRIGEMYGEDPWMNGEYAAIYISTMQEKDSNGFMKVATTIKHYLYGTSTGGINQASMLGGVNHIYNTLALPYINVMKKVSPASVMPSYSTIDGVPAHSNSYLLQELLRQQFGFDGVVVSDADAISMLYQTHKTAASLNDAGIKSLAAGVQLELAIGFPTAFESLTGNQTVDGVARNVNEAVSRILDLKFKLGLFDKSLEADIKALKSLRSEKHLKVNEKISSESIVLLKNDGILPLDSAKKVAVLGPLAEVINTGTYAAWTNKENGNNTLLDAIKTEFGAENVRHVRGVDIVDTDDEQIDAAVEAAKDAGLAIVALGSIAVGWEDSLVGDRTDGEGNTHASLKLPGRQEELLEAITATGTPAILVLTGGQAFELHNAAQDARAILHGFHGGEETGRALVDIITGRVNPSGKLTLTFPARSEVNPVYYNREQSDWQSAGAIQFPYLKNNYIYPFGHGLSFTTFEFSGARLDKSTYGTKGNVKVTVKISNTGKVDGQEVAQVYFRQKVAPLSLPVKRLVGFSKVLVSAGSSKTVEINIPVQELGYWLDGNYRVDKGTYEFFVGDSSADSSLSSALTAVVA